MIEPALIGPALLIIGGLEMQASALVHSRHKRDMRGQVEAHGAPLARAFSAPEQHTIPPDMQALLNKLETPGGDHGGQGSF